MHFQKHEFSRFAALCSFAPEVVRKHATPKAAALALEIQSFADSHVKRLLRDLQSWCIGFEGTRINSHSSLRKIWLTPEKSLAVLGQNAAGGVCEKKIRRKKVFDCFDHWWNSPSKSTPAMLVGKEGVGKTWASLDWFEQNLDLLPITIIASARAFTGVRDFCRNQVIRFLATHLAEITPVRSSEAWEIRIERLLLRPESEGPAILLFIDGLNEDRTIHWKQLLRVLQTEPFVGRVRLVVSTRRDHFQDALRSGMVLPNGVFKIDVSPFDTAEGGELDALLDKHGLNRSDIREELIDLCCNARLFTLVIRLRNRFSSGMQVTVHRLLWEYGRDELSGLTNSAFSEREWEEWLRKIAKLHMDNSSAIDRDRLRISIASNNTLEPNEIYNRLSQIVDGEFVVNDSLGLAQLDPILVEHALGLFVLESMKKACPLNRESALELLAAFVQPLAGMDQEPKILRAAATIAISDVNTSTLAGHMVSAIVIAWLRSQNLPFSHQKEIADIGAHIISPLLDTIETSTSYVMTKPGLIAASALREVLRRDESQIERILPRISSWFGVISKDIEAINNVNGDFEKQKLDALTNRIGNIDSGTKSILEVEFKIVDNAEGSLLRTGIEIVQDMPICTLRLLFEIAAISYSVEPMRYKFEGLEWMCLLNERDPDDSAKMLRELSAELLARRPESGIHSELSSRVAANLLWLAGIEADEERAETINPSLDRHWDYDRDYLANPSQSRFRLERRHADDFLSDVTIPLISRISRSKELFFDPTYVSPKSFVAELEKEIAGFDVNLVDNYISHTIADNSLDMILPALARTCAQSLSELINRRAADILQETNADKLHWKLVRSTNFFVCLPQLTCSDFSTAHNTLSTKQPKEKWFSMCKLMHWELWASSAEAQIQSLLSDELDGIDGSFGWILREPLVVEIDNLLMRFGNGTEQQVLRLLVAFSMCANDVSESAWAWLTLQANSAIPLHREIAFETLASIDLARFGQFLVSSDWKWNSHLSRRLSHYGSLALIECSKDRPFEFVLGSIALPFLPRAVSFRSNDVNEARIAAERIDTFISNPKTILASVPFSQFRGDYIWHDHVYRDDVLSICENCPEHVARWLQGMEEQSEQFAARVSRAECFFLALCESLLVQSPQTGCQLWRALQGNLLFNYLGMAKVDEMLHLLFRVPDSDEVSKLRLEILDLSNCNTDKKLFDLALAANCQGRTDWLAQVIGDDRKSGLVWKQRRAEMLASFAIGNTTPIPEAWPEGQLRTVTQHLVHECALRRWREACSRHWWDEFIESKSQDEAYCAWVLFLESADRRADIYLANEHRIDIDPSDLARLKRCHFLLNRDSLDREMKKREDKLDKTFLGERIVEGIGPWRREIQFDD